MGSIKDEMKSPAEALLEPELAADSTPPITSCAPRGECWSGCDITITPAPEEPPDGPELDSACVEDDVQASSGPAAEQPDAGSPDSVVEPPTPADATEAGEPGSPHASLEQLPKIDTSHTDRDSQRDTLHDTTRKQTSQERDADREKVVGGSSVERQVPGSPARLQHIQTQVSLEVVQCHSVATSPMTPPEGAGAFHFLYSSTKLGAVDMETGGVEMQVGRKVEYRSVATAPMTPRTPTALAFPEVSERERVQTEERKVEEGVEEEAEAEKINYVSESVPSHMEMYPHLDLAPAAKCTTPKKVTKQSASNSDPPSDTSVNCPKSDAADSNGCCDVSVEDPAEEQPHQHLQRMGTMDQDITILVTHHDSPEEQDQEGVKEAEEEEGGTEQQTVSAQRDLRKLAENGELNIEDSPTGVNSAVVGAVTADQAATGSGEDVMINESRKTPPADQSNTLQKEKPSGNSSENIQADKDPVVLQSPNQNESSELAGDKGIKKTACSREGTGPGARLQKLDQVPGSPARLQHIQTQVSLEVVQCHSVATSPMTPPEGAGAFHFLYSSTKLGAVDMETGGVEMQVGRKVEYRSVATAPMTPRTPTALTFPEVSKRERVQMKDEGSEKEREDRKNMQTEEKTDGKKDGTEAKTVEKDKVTEMPSEKEEEEVVKPAESNTERKEGKKEGKKEGEKVEEKTTQKVEEKMVKAAESNTERTEGKKEGEKVEEKTTQKVEEKTVKAAESNTERTEGKKEGEKVGEKVADKEGDKKGEKEGEKVGEKEGEKERKKDGEKVGEKEGKKVGEKEEEKVGKKEIEKVGDKEGEKVGEKEGKKEREKVGEKEREKVVDKEGEKVVDKEGKKEREKVGEKEGDKVGDKEGKKEGAKEGEKMVEKEGKKERKKVGEKEREKVGDKEGEKVVDKEGKKEREKVGEKGGEKVVEGEKVGEKMVEKEGNKEGAKVGEKEREKVGDKEGEKVVEKEGKKEREKVGDKVGEKEGKKEREKVGEKVGEKAGEKEGKKVGENGGEPGGEQEKSEKSAELKSEENSEELVQEVCWDEKGMTWEVYGAVVEVAVLGSAIQKHLEKQVKKHKKQPSSALPPPPPLSPSATPLPSTPPPAGGSGQGGRERKSRAGRRGEREGKRGRQRRNPFRLLLQNMQQPHCCSRAHAAE